MQNKILIIRLSALGDVAMTIPAIYSLALRYPNWEVTVLTRPFFSRMFVNRPENIRFILFEKEHSSFFGFLRLIRQLHKEKFTVVADFHNLLRSWLIDLSFKLTGTKVAMLQKRRSERKRIFTEKKASTPFIKRYAEVLTELGFNIEPMITHLPENGENPLPDSLFERDEKFWVGIAPTARYSTKTYPLENMKEVVRLLSQHDDTRVFLFGGKGEKSTYQEWEKMGDNIKCVAGTMQFEQELALMHQLDVMVSMDSANQHLASLMGTRVVSIWGATTPLCGFMPWNQSEDDAIIANLPCQPCSVGGSRQCPLGTTACLKAITPEQIMEKILKA